MASSSPTPATPRPLGAGTIISGYTANADGTYTLNLFFQPGGYNTPDAGLVSAYRRRIRSFPSRCRQRTPISCRPARQTRREATPTSPTPTSSDNSKAAEGSNIGITIAGAAIPGASDLAPDAANIEQYFQTTTLPNGLTGYVSGGWTGSGSGSPNAFGYLDPSNHGSVYIAPNITFDFSELQYEGKTPQTGLADWETLFNQLSANSDRPIIVWPWHDYGITNWPTNGTGTTPPGYNEALYQDFIAYAHDAGYEFVTTEDLAQRVAAEQAATISETTSGNVITATVTPGTAGGGCRISARWL